MIPRLAAGSLLLEELNNTFVFAGHPLSSWQSNPCGQQEDGRTHK